MGFLLTFVAFWPTWFSFHSVWVGYVYSHGYVVLLITLALLWKHRAVLVVDDGGWEPAFVALVPLTLAWLFAIVLNVQTLHQAAVPALLVAWVVAVFGRRSASALLPIAFIFSLVVPLWGVLVGPLQSATIAASSLVVRALGIEADIQGEFISIPSGTFQIAGSCSGLNYLMVGLLLAALYGYFFTRRTSTRLMILVSGALISMMGNWIRVSGLVVIGNATAMESSLMEEHGWYGWLIFTAGLPFFFWVSHRLARRDESLVLQETPEGRADPSSVTEVVDMDGSGVGVVRRAAVATVLGLLGPIAYFGLGLLPVSEPIPPAGPAIDSGWSEVVGEERPYAWSPSYAGAQEVVTRLWAKDGSAVLVDRLIFRDQGQGAELVNELNVIAADSILMGQRELGPLGTPVRQVREAAVLLGEQRIRIWYWYRVGGLNTASAANAKLLELPAFFQRNAVSELVAISTKCSDDPCEAGGEALLAFLQSGAGR